MPPRSARARFGFVYICNPNNPTGVIVTKDEIKQLLDGLPSGMPVLIDEAYHHYVNDPKYATAMPYVNEGRPIIVARTFSKIGGDGGDAHRLCGGDAARSCRRCGRTPPAASTCSPATARPRR